MNTLVKYIGIALAGFALASCTVDNYDQPNSWLHGAAIYTPDGGEPEYIEQDLFTTNGTQLVVTELNFVDKYTGNAAATTTDRTLNFKTDGTYSDKGFFAGQYKIKADVCNFFPFEDEITVPTGEFVYNINAVPYVRVLVDSILFNETECNVYAYFKLQCPDESVTVKEAALFVDQNKNVSKTLNGAGDNSCKVTIGKTPDGTTQYRLKMSTTYMSPVPGDFYFRVGALSGESQATYNYATAQKLHIDNSKYEEPEEEPLGVSVDNCDSSEGWGGGFAGDWADCREGTGSIGKTANTDCTVFFQKEFTANPVDCKVTVKAGHILMWFYVGDLACLHRDNGQIEFCSGGSCDNHELTLPMNILTSLAAGWNQLDVPMTKCTDGGFDPSNLNYIRIYEVSDEGETTLAIDDIRVYAPDVLDACESVDGWASNIGSKTWTLDYSDKREGEASISISGAQTGDLIFQKSFDAFCAPCTKDNGYYSMYFYCSDPTILQGDGDMQLELTSSGGPDQKEMGWRSFRSTLSAGWNKLHLKMTEADDNGCDLEAVNFTRMYCTKNSGDDITIKLDKIGFYDFPED